MKKIIVSILIMFLLSGAASAQPELPEPGILPDSPFYGPKKVIEGIGDVFAFSEEAKVERALDHAELRLAEAEAMADKGKPEYINDLTREYGENINKSTEIAASSPPGDEKEQLAERISNATSQHINVLDGVQERVPDQAKEKIADARERSIRGNQEALKALAQENPERSAEIAMEIADSRLKEANESAQEGNAEGVAEASEEYQEYARFGQEISAIAQEAGKDPSKANEIVAKATSVHLNVLEDVKQKVPEKARASIQDAIEQSEKGREAATSELEERGLAVPGISEDTDSPSGVIEERNNTKAEDGNESGIPVEDI
ncbi:DUF5667 domain-containing protein [Methanohalophilus halophilus]|uniref:DUF5667 domain-containing protein n=1 Tax=Methanohalophilus halophilus TaxID=2177 RepID=A0A1L3PZT8_9EURY|nr:DUF5667 domain-containing protein [Methanohalophilus halophilus]APH38115.1 hypothetical protein BHR79_00540 [Methanohalophilus halophilus]RNI11020.1 hypothetical protein EFE40_02260 [Methanohalophilus halophilus]SDW82388.1 hypothetical protein SAMN04515625_1669 [Methanohalophilus halophilus]